MSCAARSQQMVGRSLAAEAPERPAPIPTEVPAEQVSVEASDTSIESVPQPPVLPSCPVQAMPGRRKMKHKYRTLSCTTLCNATQVVLHRNIK